MLDFIDKAYRLLIPSDANCHTLALHNKVLGSEPKEKIVILEPAIKFHSNRVVWRTTLCRGAMSLKIKWKYCADIYWFFMRYGSTSFFYFVTSMESDLNITSKVKYYIQIKFL